MNDNPETSSTSATLNLAVLILCFAFFTMTAFQAFMLISTRQNLTRVRANQEQLVQDGNKLRQRVQDLAGRTAKLAEDGNANAKAIVANFHRQGVEMKPPSK